jgi:hypothetical protein
MPALGYSLTTLMNEERIAVAGATISVPSLTRLYINNLAGSHGSAVPQTLCPDYYFSPPSCCSHALLLG